jgi:hypothetical protein
VKKNLVIALQLVVVVLSSLAAAAVLPGMAMHIVAAAVAVATSVLVYLGAKAPAVPEVKSGDQESGS